MNEELIKFETAKLARSVGFNWESDSISTPTQSLLQKWIREKYDIHVNPEPYRETADHTGDVTGYYMGDIIHGTGGEILYVGDDNYSTYEKALEAGLLKALKEIKL